MTASAGRAPSPAPSSRAGRAGLSAAFCALWPCAVIAVLLQNPLRRPEVGRERRGQGGQSRRCRGQYLRCRPTQILGARSRPKPGWGSAIAP